MKKQIVLMTIAALVGIGSVNAQGGFQRRTVQERVKYENTERFH